MKKTYYLLGLASIPLTLLSNLSAVILFLNHNPISQENTFENLFFSLVYQNSYSKDNISITFLIATLMIPIFYCIMLGSFIYSGTHISNTYYFVRQKSRLKWYSKVTAQLSLITFIFCFFQIALPFLVAVFNSGEPITSAMLQTFVSVFVSMFLYTLITTLAVNVFSIYLGTAFSFLIVYTITIILYYLSINIEYVYMFGKKIDFSIFNIADNTIVSWKSSPQTVVAGISVSLIYVIAIIIIGYLCIKKIDIGLNDKENIV